MNKEFEDFTITVLKLGKLVQRVKQYEMGEYGLKAIHVMCIYYLREHSDGLTVGELSRLALDDKAAVSRAVATLREHGLIDGEAGAYNGKIRLTESGAAVAEVVRTKADAAVAYCGADLSDTRRAEFYAALGEISCKLGEYTEMLAGRRARGE